jgi:hypothetical protein
MKFGLRKFLIMYVILFCYNNKLQSSLDNEVRIFLKTLEDIPINPNVFTN